MIQREAWWGFWEGYTEPGRVTYCPRNPAPPDSMRSIPSYFEVTLTLNTNRIIKDSIGIVYVSIYLLFTRGIAGGGGVV